MSGFSHGCYQEALAVLAAYNTASFPGPKVVVIDKDEDGE